MPNKMSDTQLSYLAGIIDGEGYIGVSRRKYKGTYQEYLNFTLKLIVSNTDVSLIKWIIENTDGKLYVVKHTQSKPPNKQVYQIYWQNEEARKILQQVEKYLIVKKERANFIIREYPTKFLRDRNKRELCHNRLVFLNKRNSNDNDSLIQ